MRPEVRSLSGILTPDLIIFLALLGLSPTAAKKRLLALYRAKKFTII